MSYAEFLSTFYRETPHNSLTHVIESGKRAYYDPKDNAAFAKQNKLDFFSVGRFLGEDKRGFQPSPFGVEHASTFASEKQKVVLDNKGAWLFLCGRDVFGRSILQGNPKRNKAVFLYDEQKNLLGYGVWVVDEITKREENKTVIEHRQDKGSYIRRK